MSKKTSKIRLQKELKAFSQDRIPYIPRVHVNERNILEWHFLFEGPPDTPYQGGWYVAKLKFPARTQTAVLPSFTRTRTHHSHTRRHVYEATFTLLITSSSPKWTARKKTNETMKR